MKQWKTLSSNYVYKTPFGNLRKDKCELPSGVIIDPYYVNEYADWVNAFVVTRNHQVVFVEQYRYPGNGNYIEIPAGKVEKGETYEQAIVREVREETGYVSDKKPKLLGEYMVNPATQTNKVISYLIEDAYQRHEQALDTTEHEHVTVKTVPLHDIEPMIEKGEINQFFTVSVYYMVKHLLDNREK